MTTAVLGRPGPNPADQALSGLGIGGLVEIVVEARMRAEAKHDEARRHLREFLAGERLIEAGERADIGAPAGRY